MQEFLLNGVNILIVFFVKGVEKGRIVYENGKIFAAHHTEIPNQEQYTVFRDICISLARKIEQEGK